SKRNQCSGRKWQCVRGAGRNPLISMPGTPCRKTMEQLAWLSVDSALPAERRPPTAGRKPVSFGLAAPNGGRLNSNGAFSIHDVGARREIPVADRRPME